MLLRSADYCWRLVVTGLAFLALWLGGFILATLVIPAATLWIRDAQARGQAARRMIHRSFQLYIRILCLFRVISVTITGEERLAAARGVIVVANHPSLLDVVLIVSLLPDARCVIKYQLWRSRLLGPLLRLAGYLPNGGDPEILMAHCQRVLGEGSNLIVFPEGTRSIPGQKLHFQRGFAHMATIAGCDLQPVVISCDPPVLLKGQAWHRIPSRRPHFQLDVQPMVDTGTFLRTQPRARAARAIVAQLESFYQWKVLHG
jgi:1-acyl-sn-glycerol-3-phosphate acyltransferase